MRSRTLEIILKFLKSDYPIQLGNLAAELNLSSRTIRNEIQEINEYLSANKICHINNIRNKGFVLEITKEQKKMLYEKITNTKTSMVMSKKERILDLILILSVSSSFQATEENLLDYYCISKSTLDDDLRFLKNKLSKYKINLINILDKRLVFNSEEQAIRIMLFDVISEYVGNFDFMIDDVSFDFSRVIFKYIPLQSFQKVKDIINETLTSMDDSKYKNQILLFIIIWIYRIKNNHIIYFIAHQNEGLSYDEEWSILLEKIIQSFDLSSDISILDSEAHYILFLLNIFNSKDINNSFDWVTSQLITINLITFIEKHTHIPFSLSERMLYENVSKHITGLITRLKNNIRIINPLLDNIRDKFRVLFDSISAFTKNQHNVLGYHISEDEIAFLTIHFSISSSMIKQQQSYSFKTLVVCHYGIATANLLAENLKEYFDDVDVIGIFSQQDLVMIDKIDFDVIVSTFMIPESTKPVLVINPIIKPEIIETINNFLIKNKHIKRIDKRVKSNQLFKNIIALINDAGGQVDGKTYNRLEHILKESNLQLNKRELQPMIEDILSDKEIQLQITPKNWRSAISLAAKPLLDNTSIERRYIDAMIDSIVKYGPYIVVADNFALAHARPEDGVNRLGLSVATLKNEVLFGDVDQKSVKIIFCLSAIDSYSHLDIIKTLIETINHSEKINQLISCTDIAEFKKILFTR